MSLVAKVSAFRPGILEFESQMRQWGFLPAETIRIGAIKASDPEICQPHHVTQKGCSHFILHPYF